MEKKIQYKWIASSDDGAYEAESSKVFDTEEECYNDMRNAALEKMKWNTEYSEDFESDEQDCIGYHVTFNRNTIVHESYSGIYTYQIVESFEKETMRFILDFDVIAEDKEAIQKIERMIQSSLVSSVESSVEIAFMEALTRNKIDKPCVQVQHIK